MAPQSNPMLSPNSQPPAKRMHPLLIALLALLVVGGGSCVACFVWLGTGPEGGVRLGNQMEGYALEYIRARGLLQEGEEIVCYYDATTALDGTESALVTTKRVLYDNQGHTTSVSLRDVENISTRNEGIMGDIIDVKATNGQMLRIEIAALNDGETFVRLLRQAVERTQQQAFDSNPEAGPPVDLE